jgi:hypothetical protein
MLQSEKAEQQKLEHIEKQSLVLLTPYVIKTFSSYVTIVLCDLFIPIHTGTCLGLFANGDI